MIVEFKTYNLNENSDAFKIMKNYNTCNEVVIVGEEKIGNEEYFKVLQLKDTGMRLIKGLSLQEQSFYVKKEDLIPTNIGGIGTDYIEIDIPAEYLSVGIIEDVQRLNNLGG